MDALIAEFAIYLTLGGLAGVLAGLLGVGGGLVIVPTLAWIFARAGMFEGILMHLAIGTSLATIVVTSLSSVRAHHRRGAVDWGVVARLTPGILAGAALGVLVADLLPSAVLRMFFGLFALAVAVQMGLRVQPAAHRGLLGRLGMAVAGAFIGSVSAVVGIGGGSLTVPLLLWCNVPVRRAVATSSACGLPIALAGAAGFMLAGRGAVGLPAGSSGYVYWPAFAGIVSASVLFAPLGARLAHGLPTVLLQRIFAAFLAVVGLRMVIGS